MRRLAAAPALLLALALAAPPAAAQTLTGVEQLLTEWTTFGRGPFAVFALLVGLIIAWLVAIRTLVGGLAVGAAVIVLAAIVGNYEAIASAVGLG